MPDYTVSADVDSMLRSANDAAIRSAIGVGTTDAPTFLAQTLTGQSLTGTQATSLVDLSATWNTTGTPSALKLNVTDTASNAASKLLDLQVGGVSKFDVSKAGVAKINNGGTLTWTSPDSLVISSTSAYQRVLAYSFYASGLGSGIGDAGGQNGCQLYLGSASGLGWYNGTSVGSGGVDTILIRDGAPGILAQRNGTTAQAFRVYNTYPGTTANEWFEIDWKTTANSVRIGTNQAGTGGTRQMILTGGGGSTPGFQFNVGAAATWIIDAAGAFKAGFDNTFDIGASGANRPRNIYTAGAINIGNAFGLIFDGRTVVFPPAAGVLRVGNTTDSTGFRLNGGTLDYCKVQKFDGTGFGAIQGKLTTDTAYTATVVTPTGFLTLYDSTGTAYRVPCVV